VPCIQDPGNVDPSSRWQKGLMSRVVLSCALCSTCKRCLTQAQCRQFDEPLRFPPSARRSCVLFWHRFMFVLSAELVMNRLSRNMKVCLLASSRSCPQIQNMPVASIIRLKLNIGLLFLTPRQVTNVDAFLFSMQ
jgi:hypothetical protein